MFVGNLDDTTVESEMMELFEPFGDVKEIVMLTGKDGKSKRSCFVKFFAKSAAEAAINTLNGKHTDKNSTNQMVIRFARDKPQSAPMSSMSMGGGMGGGMGMQGMQQAMQPMPAANAYAPYSQTQAYGMGAQAGYGMGYGPVTTPAMGGGGGGGAAPGFGRGPSGANLYVNNLSKQASEKDVTKMFADFGNVISVKLFHDHGYGFVSYDSAQSAQNAIQYLNGLAMGDGSRRLEVSLKKEKGAGGSRFAPY